MSHHHDHDHPHDHDHDHDHHHGHAHSHGHVPLSFAEKLGKLLDHWAQHNAHHAADYRRWATDARAGGQLEVAAMLESAAELTDTIGDRLETAREKVRPA